MGVDAKTGGALACTGLALIFLIAAAGVPDWQHASGVKSGVFKTCTSFGGTDTCYNMKPDCKIGDTGATVEHCNNLRATQAFLVIGILTSAVAVILMCMVMFGGKQSFSKPAFVLLVIAAFCALVAFASYTKLKVDGLTYGAGFALTILAWLLFMAAAGLWHVGSMKEGGATK